MSGHRTCRNTVHASHSWNDAAEQPQADRLPWQHLDSIPGLQAGSHAKRAEPQTQRQHEPTGLLPHRDLHAFVELDIDQVGLDAIRPVR